MVRIASASVQSLRRKLLAWYRAHGRSHLPWRQKPTPYAVWVSEAMLQQTQVATVIPYYRRFLRRYPTVKALARAPLTQVLDSWSGLGYYSRARNLHAGARAVVEEHGGKLPSRVGELRRLPGIGRYTAGAIASIAYDRPAPILDGNVIRVLSRLFGIRQDPTEVTTRNRLWELAGQLVPSDAPGDFNQALMDLGATLCTPRRPRCLACPLSAACVARKKGWQELIPRRRPAAPRKKIHCACALIEKEGRLLIARRPLSGLLGGLWEFPGGECAPGRSRPADLARLLRERLGITVTPLAPRGRIRQTLTHRLLEIEAFHCRWSGGAVRPRWYGQTRWVRKKDLGKSGLTAGMREVATLAMTPGAGGTSGRSRESGRRSAPG